MSRRFWWRFHRGEVVRTAAGVVLVAGVVLALALTRDSKTFCENRPLECNLLSDGAATAIVAGIGILFFAWKLRAIVAGYTKAAHGRPHALLGVDAPSRVAGEERYKQHLLQVIARDLLNERRTRGGPVPGKLITGSAGSGKTTAMVLLTRFLAERATVPVPVSLRGREGPIKLVQLAREQFTDRAETRTVFGDQGERVFARLRRRGQIVVLADGLDEAIPGASRSEREVALAAAIGEALEGGVSVVATSRSRELGRDLPLTEFELPQLSHEDAASYVCAEAADEGLRETVEAADLRETPFYLTIAEPLRRAGRLADWRGSERLSLRVDLLDRYVDALLDDALGLDAAGELRSDERELAVRELSELACAMLRLARASVPVGEVAELAACPFGTTQDEVVDVHTIVDGGRALELLELADRETCQFRHSVMQSYLASRAIREAPGEVGRLLGARTGNELLTAIVMAGAWRPKGESGIAREARARSLVAALTANAPARTDRRGLAVVAAAARITSACGLGHEDELVTLAAAQWDKADTAARLEAVAPLAGLGTEAAYRLVRRGLDDEAFHVRLEAAQALGAGGEVAYRAVRDDLRRALDRHRQGNGDVPREVHWTLGNLGFVLPLLRVEGGDGGRAPELDELIQAVAVQLHPSAEGTIARGVKLAAIRARSVDRLAEDATALLEAAQWWYSKVCLMHAAVLAANGSRDRVRRAIAQRAQDEAEHPFVREAARQCLAALAGADPERWIWGDEREVVKQARPTRARAAAAEDGLTVEAVQLAADVALALNLTLSVPDAPVDVEERRRRQDERLAKWMELHGLPHCLHGSRDRRELFGERPCPAHCHFDLCPHRADAPGSLRCDFSEAFCRQQRHALPRRRARPRWQRGFRRRRGLRRFWNEMAEDARRAAAARAAVRRRAD
ncbi:MAG TPA: ATP-binding protein [Solirubrobacteraceae bacterium]|nr:ATP-binding protein [Solirubrobacteraceae bacterium]